MSKSRFFLLLCLFFLLGVFIRSLFDLPELLKLGILILGIMLVALFWARDWRLVVVGFCLMVLLAGVWRLDLAERPSVVQTFNDQGKIVLTGVVSNEPDVRSDNIRYKIIVKKVVVFSSVTTGSDLGKILLVAKKYPAWRYGDQLSVTGELKTPSVSEDFDYQKYLAKDDIYSVIYYPEIKFEASGQGNWLKGWLFFIKNKFQTSLNGILPEPANALMGGLLLGEKQNFSAEMTDALKRTGTTHITALSGYNITIIAMSLVALFNFLLIRRAISFWLAVAAIVGFVIMTGAAASASRAAVMGILLLLAGRLGRLYQIRNALALAAVIMVWLNPKVLVWDLGFQLSFAATLGLVYIYPLIFGWLGRLNPDGSSTKSWLGWRETLAATLSAQLAALGLLLINFGQLSLIAPLANVLILLFIPVTMLLGFLAGLIGIGTLALGKIFGWPAWLLLMYEIKTIETLAKIPLAAVEFKWNWWLGAAYYLILILVVRRLGRKYQSDY